MFLVINKGVVEFYEIISCLNYVKIFYTNARNANIWVFEAWNKTHVSKSFFYEEAKTLIKDLLGILPKSQYLWC